MGPLTLLPGNDGGATLDGMRGAWERERSSPTPIYIVNSESFPDATRCFSARRHEPFSAPGEVFAGSARIETIGQRPERRVGVDRIDILADRDAHLTATGAQRRGAAQPARLSSQR